MFPMKEVFNEQFFTFFERICQPYFLENTQHFLVSLRKGHVIQCIVAL